MQSKTERFEMRLNKEKLDELDRWRTNQTEPISRAEAARRLIDIGLSAAGPKPLTLSDGEKMIMRMLSDVYGHLKIDGDIDPAFVNSAILSGHHWGLGWKYPGTFDRHADNEHVVSEVVCVLEMWQFLESGYAQLSEEDKTRVAEEAPFGKDVTFPGFDGNNESEYFGVANFLVRDLERFTTFHGRGLNSHMPSVERYRRMLKAFQPMRRKLTGGKLSASQIVEILQGELLPD